MIEYIIGRLVDLTAATATLQTAGGVGYGLNISLNTYASLENEAASDRDVKLYVHESIREDAWTLYGFSREEERALFRLLIGVSGVGAASARVILSTYSVAELEHILSGSDVAALKKVKGIGAKTAERIVVDLRDKINVGGSTLISVGPGGKISGGEVYEEALAALVALGFVRSAAQKALDKVFGADPSLKVDVAIKKALALL